MSLKYAYADVYPLKTALVLDMLLKMGLLEMDDEGLRLQEEQLRSFLHATRARQNERLYRLWKELAFPAYAWQQHAVLLLETIPEGEWFAPEMLLSSLRRYGLAEGAENSDDAAERVRLLREQWLEPLTGLGWLERGCIGLGREGQGGASTYYRWRWRAAGTEGEAVEEMPGAFLVQPDFEILVPPDVPLWVQWELICLCDPPVRDVLSVTKLTKASLKYALEQGRTADDVLYFLEEHAAYGLPDNVRLTVEQWAKPFGKTNLTRVVLLRCADADTAAALTRLRRCRSCWASGSGTCITSSTRTISSRSPPHWRRPDLWPGFRLPILLPEAEAAAILRCTGIPGKREHSRRVNRSLSLMPERRRGSSTRGIPSHTFRWKRGCLSLPICIRTCGISRRLGCGIIGIITHLRAKIWLRKRSRCGRCCKSARMAPMFGSPPARCRKPEAPGA